MKRSTIERTFTELDLVRLRNLIRRDRRGGNPSQGAGPIDGILDEGDVVPSRQVPPDVVTMYTRVVLLDHASGRRSTLTVCYPADADPHAGFVSVLSPVGWSLLGLRVGDLARWTTPGGDENEAEIVEILFQPEASGDYTM